MDEYLNNLIKDLSLIMNKPNDPEDGSSGLIEAIDSSEEDEDDSETKLHNPIRANYSNIGDFGVVNARHSGGHQGVDLRAPKGTEIYSISSGKVTNTGSNAKGGLVVSIAHDNGFRSYYAHLDSIKCKKGDTVTKDSVIGTVGNTGNANVTSAHLHFQLWKDNTLVNPANYIYVPKYSLKSPEALSSIAAMIKLGSQIEVPTKELNIIGSLCKEFLSKSWKDELGYHFDKLNPVFKHRLSKAQSDSNLIISKGKYVSWIDFNPRDSKYFSYFKKKTDDTKAKDQEILSDLTNDTIKQVLTMLMDDYYKVSFDMETVRVPLFFELEVKEIKPVEDPKSKKIKNDLYSHGRFLTNPPEILSILTMDTNIDLTDERNYERALLDLINTCVHEFMHFIQFFINKSNKPSPMKEYFRNINYYDKTNDVDGFINFFENLEKSGKLNSDIKTKNFKAFKLFNPKTKLDENRSKFLTKTHKDKVKASVQELKEYLANNNNPETKKHVINLIKNIKDGKLETGTQVHHHLDRVEFFPQMFTESVVLASHLKSIPVQFRNAAIKLYFGAINYQSAMGLLKEKTKEFPSLSRKKVQDIFQLIAKSPNEVKAIKKDDIKRWEEACSRVYSSLVRQGLI